MPTIARIWGAIHGGEAGVIVDQQNLRVWVWADDGYDEVLDPDRLARIRQAAKLIGA